MPELPTAMTVCISSPLPPPSPLLPASHVLVSHPILDGSANAYPPLRSPPADEFLEAVPLLRAVIRECHRFLIDHPDPSVVYADPRPNRSSQSPEAITPTEERLHRDWDSDIDTPSVASWSSRRRTSMAVTTTSRYVPYSAHPKTSNSLPVTLADTDPRRLAR